MHGLSSIIESLIHSIPEDCDGLFTEIEYYTKERGYGIQGDCIDFSNGFVRYMNYSGSVNANLSEHIHALNKEFVNTPQRWNKIQITVFRDKRSEIKLWWDEEYQRDLYRAK